MLVATGRNSTYDTAYWYDAVADKAYDATSLYPPSGGNLRVGKTDTTYAMRIFGLAQFNALLSLGQIRTLYESVMG